MPELPATIMEAINGAELPALLHWLDCDKNSGPELFTTVEAFNAWMIESGQNGDYRIEAAVERRIAYLEREDAARELCFQRAEELRKQSAPVVTQARQGGGEPS